MHLILKLIGWKCWCNKTSRIFNDNQGYYLRCLDCGRRLSYDWAALGNLDGMLQTFDHGIKVGKAAALNASG